jgi:hypothetical protein
MKGVGGIRLGRVGLFGTHRFAGRVPDRLMEQSGRRRRDALTRDVSTSPPSKEMEKLGRTKARKRPGFAKDEGTKGVIREL